MKQQSFESHGTPHMEAKPTEFPCQGPACDKHVITYLTDEDVEAHETVQVYRHTAETDDERLIRYWFCSSDCHTAFINAIESGERSETLYDST
jgi:hypothetical protein